MLTRVNESFNPTGALVKIQDASFPSPFVSGLEYSSPARGTWNIVHTGMLIPEAHQIFVCAAGCLRGVILTAAEMNALDRFSTIEVLESNILNGDLEDLAINGVADILSKLPKKPPAVLLYTNCLHHFTGCDLNLIYKTLRERFPDIDFVDCYMNPIMRKSGLNPDQLMRSRLYMLLKQREINDNAVAIIGNDFPTDEDSELLDMLDANGFKVHEITSCKSYEEYQQMAESRYYISYLPAAKAGGDMLAARLGGKHIYLPLSFDYDEIDESLNLLADTLGVPAPDYGFKRAECDEEIAKTKELIGETPIAIDYTFCSRPTSIAKLLLDKGFNVERLYVDAYTGEEEKDFEHLRNNYPQLELYPTVHAKMRFMREPRPTNFLAIGQKAAHMTNTAHFVNIVEGGGMFGYEAIIRTMRLMREAFLEEKDTRRLIQMKALGCESCL